MWNLATRTRLDPSGFQVVDVIVSRGYHPALIEAAAGIPIRLAFHREDDDPCSERVAFSSPRIDRRIAPTGTTTVELPGQRPGDVRFTCGMGRYRGRIRVIDDRRAPVRDEPGRLVIRRDKEPGAPVALVVSLSPLVAFLVVGTLGGPGALAAAVAAVVVWVVGATRVVRRSIGEA